MVVESETTFGAEAPGRVMEMKGAVYRGEPSGFLSPAGALMDLGECDDEQGAGQSRM